MFVTAHVPLAADPQVDESLLRLHVLSALGAVELGRLSTSGVRFWHSELVSGQTSAITAAKAYRLLRAILATAVEDELIAKNPCTIRGAGEEHSAERSVASVADVYTLAEVVEPRFRALILTAAFTSMRQGELFGLRRRNLDLLHATISVTDQLQTLRDGTLEVLVPKSKAGVRTVCVPALLVPELEAHISAYVGADADDLVFTGAKGAPLRRNHWNRKGRAATRAAGLEHLHFHDLRHTGNTLAAATGASTKELMARMGHASPRAALIYQHATRERDAAIADALNRMIASAAPEAPPAAVVALGDHKRVQ